MSENKAQFLKIYMNGMVSRFHVYHISIPPTYLDNHDNTSAIPAPFALYP
uniref:Uncharacterized protein n=1 Tax=Daphnia magna TaxID=35525 RepID=A0A0P6H992_9CRUS